jgi:hypothetical protein
VDLPSKVEKDTTTNGQNKTNYYRAYINKVIDIRKKSYRAHANRDITTKKDKRNKQRK